MTTLDSLKKDILSECEEDHVGLWSVIRDAEDRFPKEDEATIRDRVLQVLSELLQANEIKAGFPAKAGKFRSLKTTPDKILEQIEAEWPVGQRPTIGEGLWFARARKSERNQQEAGLASAPAGHKKRLGKQSAKNK